VESSAPESTDPRACRSFFFVDRMFHLADSACFDEESEMAPQSGGFRRGLGNGNRHAWNSGRNRLSIKGIFSSRIGHDPRTFYAIPLLQVVVFAGLIIAAFRFRFSPAAHKRLILIATISLLGPAINRWPVALIQKVPVLTSAILLGFILMLVAYDIWTLGKVHRETLRAGLTVVISQLLLFPIGRTALWHSFADRATRIWIAHNF